MRDRERKMGREGRNLKPIPWLHWHRWKYMRTECAFWWFRATERKKESRNTFHFDRLGHPIHYSLVTLTRHLCQSLPLSGSHEGERNSIKPTRGSTNVHMGEALMDDCVLLRQGQQSDAREHDGIDMNLLQKRVSSEHPVRSENHGRWIQNEVEPNKTSVKMRGSLLKGLMLQVQYRHFHIHSILQIENRAQPFARGKFCKIVCPHNCRIRAMCLF